jgi:hypothetical protein
MAIDTEIIDDYYETHSVYRAVIVCNNDITAMQLKQELQEKDYTVSMILYDSLDDDRPLYSDIFQNFHDSLNRMLIITYSVLLDLHTLIKCYVLPHQNLVIYYKLGYEKHSIVEKWLHDCKSTGFIHSCNELLVE